MPNVGQLKQLTDIPLTYPVRNKAKTINTHIVNFQGEMGAMKQEVFMMEFNLLGAVGGDLGKIRGILGVD